MPKERKSRLTTGIFDFVDKVAKMLKTLNVKVLNKTSCTVQTMLDFQR